MTREECIAVLGRAAMALFGVDRCNRRWMRVDAKNLNEGREMLRQLNDVIEPAGYVLIEVTDWENWVVITRRNSENENGTGEKGEFITQPEFPYGPRLVRL